MSLAPLRDLLGPMRGLAEIAPPVDYDKATKKVSGGSYERWRTFFSKAMPIAGDSPLGHSLMKCYSLLREKKAEGVPYETAIAAWNAQCEAINPKLAAADRERAEALARARAERDPKQRRIDETDALFGYANERIKA